jgi:hypothetical protein
MAFYGNSLSNQYSGLLRYTSNGDGRNYSYLNAIKTVEIGSGVTSIDSYVFNNCYNLTSITIPSGVTSIGSSVFNNCNSLAELHFKPSSPPTVSNSNAFTNIPTDCIIYVPYSADHSILEAYKTATNWSTYASKIQEEPV